MSMTPHMTPCPTGTPHVTMPPYPTMTPHMSMTPHMTMTPYPTMTPNPAEMTPHPMGTPHETPMPHGTPCPMNISTRLQVEPGESVAIGGFLITGSAPKRVAIRGMGPSLRAAGCSDPVISDPMLQLWGPDNALIASNDNWHEDPVCAGEMEAAGLGPGFDSESAIIATLAPGVYTAIMNGRNAATGLGLVELYDLGPAGDSRLANMSTRGMVRTGDAVCIAGFILGSASGNATVLVRTIGPSLTNFGIANALADPVLELRDRNGLLLQSNDNWRDTQQAAIEATGIPPENDLEAAILATLPPGSYTAIASGHNGCMGVGLIEVYTLSQQ